MDLNSIYLDRASLVESNDMYGVVARFRNTPLMQQRFTDQYVSKDMLLDYLQDLLNSLAGDLCAMPEDGNRTATTAGWQMLHSVYEELKNS